MAARVDTLLAELKRAGLKLTPQRMAIVRELADDKTHPTAQDLYERLRQTHPTMSFATVYNTLDTLTAHGLMAVGRFGGAVRFDPNVDPHHHAVCDSCGAIIDLPAEPPEQPMVEKLRQDGFVVRAEERTYRGLCGRCSTH